MNGRRRFLRVLSAVASALGALASGCTSLLGRDPSTRPAEVGCAPARDGEGDFDFIVVGSGAGGGPLAANLARNGFRVLLLEAGGDDESLTYEVPAFHALASEDERYAWNFYVRHYSDQAQQERDPKYVKSRQGVLYPRCATVGGCTAHNAMILVYPANRDWDYIAEVTGDASWSSERMRAYFERLERCEYRPQGERHGADGWLRTNVANPLLLARDPMAQRLLIESVIVTLGPVSDWRERLRGDVRRGVDPNGWSFVRDDASGVCMTPMSTDGVRRVGSRELVRDVARDCQGRLEVRTRALATRILLDEQKRAVGVEYLSGAHLYGADPKWQPNATAQKVTVKAAREVVVSAGAFNSPQLLMLSGIGPPAELARVGIPALVPLDGVGQNLQDRYEISVVSRTRREFPMMRGMTLRAPGANEPGDAPFQEWRQGRGPYTTNGAMVSIIRQSTSSASGPDLFMFGLFGEFRGYYPGYSTKIAERKDVFTWAILKGHTRNTHGRVSLRSPDPWDPPEINFRFFDGDGADDDLDAVAEAVGAVRAINARCSDIVEEELVPGPRFSTREQVREYIRDNAWGHHACGTCKMGPASDATAVVDSRFAVHGVRGLRVVDASVFPKIPGFFIACAVYMISEKAADVITSENPVAEPPS